MAKARYDTTGHLAIIALDDPETLNAVSPELIEELRGLFRKAASEARAVVLTGHGKGFCSGANLVSGAAPGAVDLGGSLDTHYHPFVKQLRDLPIPFVTAVNGAAAGIGCSFALLGDLIIAGESAYFLQAFRRIGLVPDGGSTYLLPRMIGRARAMEMMLLGEKITAPQALSWGMINRVVPDSQLMDTAIELAQRLAEGPSALGIIRRLAWQALDTPLDVQLDAERDGQREAGRTQDFLEGVTAFLQKRPARFSGC